ncbi:MAG: APC family permease [Gemmataceae bacterium]
MNDTPGMLRRHFGVWQATALNVTMIVGAGVFITIPPMLAHLPGPYALLGWLVAGALILVDGLIWSELGAALPGSGGSYLYLLESYGREKLGKLMAFLFIWQFMLSGPLELASGLIAMDTFSQALSPAWADFNASHTIRVTLWESQGLALTFSPGRAAVIAVGFFLVLLLYRSVNTLGKLTFALWIGVLGIIGWVLLEGALNFDPKVAFDFSGRAAKPTDFATGLGAAMTLALYSYLGYYNICYVGDEVRDPGRTIPRAILISATLVVVLFCLVHLAMLGTVPWQEIPTEGQELDVYSLPAEFMRRCHGDWAVKLITLGLIGSCFASVFSGLLGYSRIPYGAARAGHFFRAVGTVHPRLHIPHVSLLLVGGMTLFWGFFDLQSVITALITTRILEQFVAQIVGVMLLRRTRPDLPRPFRIWLYPLPCLLALAGWLFVYLTAKPVYIFMGLLTLLVGVVVYLIWRRKTGPGVGLSP